MARSVLCLGASLCLFASVAMGKEKPVDEEMAAMLYDSGIIHEEIMAHKMVCT